MNITIKELKQREKILLDSHKSNFIEYGIALREIIEIAENNPMPKLSEEILLNDSARKYVEKEKKLYDTTKNNKHKLHIKAASDLFRKEFASIDEFAKFVQSKEKLYTFEEAKTILKSLDIYNKIRPETLIEALEMARLNMESK